VLEWSRWTSCWERVALPYFKIHLILRVDAHTFLGLSPSLRFSNFTARHLTSTYVSVLCSGGEPAEPSGT